MMRFCRPPIPVRCPSCQIAMRPRHGPRHYTTAAFPYPRRCRGLLSDRPARAGLETTITPMWRNGFVGASGCWPFFPGMYCTAPIRHGAHYQSMSFRAQREIFVRKPRFLSRSLSPSFEAGSFEMTRVGCRRRQKGCFATTHEPTALPWAIITPPRKSGARNHDHPNVALNAFVGASGCSPFFPGICCTAPDSLYWFPKINANSIVVRLIDFYELRLPRRLRLLAMTMLSCVSLRAKRRNLVTTCENDYIPSPGLRPPSPAGRGLG
jgi:hypothetical protein